MLRRGTRNLDSFLSSIARHLSDSGEWNIEREGPDAGQVVLFGRVPDIRGDLVTEDQESDSPSGLILFGGGLAGEDLELIERAVGILEGLEYAEDPPED